jgi:DNA-binding SARP family transcriptional activator
VALKAVRELGVLGPTSVRVDGVAVALRPRERDVLAALALGHPRPSSVAAIAAALWPVAAPATAKVTIQNHVARLRRALGADAVLTEGGGYRLGPTWSLDITEFDTRLERGRRRAVSGDHAAARVELEHARSLVRGEAYADLEDGAAVVAARTHRRELAAAAQEELVLALLADGAHDLAIAEATALVAEQPGRERRWAALALALYRGGQRRDSVRALGDGRRALREEAGLELGPGLAQLERLILADDTSLLTSAPASLTGHRTGVEEPLTDLFVGRAAELEETRRHLRAAFDAGAGSSVVVLGVEGAGKTAFVERVAVQAAIDGWHVVSVRCRSTPTRPLEPLGDVVRQVVDREPNPEDAFTSGLLSDLAALWADTGAPSRGDLGEAILEAVRIHAVRFPTLVVVDDAHHLPTTAAGLLGRMSQGSASVVTLLARTADQDEAEADHAAVIGLQGLDLDDTTSLLEHLTGEEVWPSLAKAMHGATGGLPARLRRAARRPGGLDPTEPAVDDAVGPMLIEALNALDPDARAVAELLVIAGAPLPRHVLAAALPAIDAGPMEDILRRGIEAGVIVETADGRVTPTDRRLDRALAGAFSADAIADQRERLGVALLEAGNVLAAAPHLLAVAGRDPRRAIEVAEAAARVASDATMFLEAAAILEGAAEVARVHVGAKDHRRLVLSLGQAELLRRAGDPRGAEIAAQVVRDAEAIGDADVVALGAVQLCSLGPLTEAGTLNVELAELVERAIAGCTTPAVRAVCAGQASLFYSLTGSIDRCLSLFRESLRNARLAGDDRVLVDALGCVYPALTHPDELAERVELAEELLALAERLDDDEARFQALHLYFSNQVQRADPLLRATFARQEAVAASLRSPGRRWMAGYQRACLAHLDGRLDDVMQISSEILELAPVARSRAMTTHWMNSLSISFARGSGEALAEEVDGIIAAQPGIPGWRGVAAWMAALRGDAARVRAECRALDRGRSLPRDMTCGATTMLLGRAVAAHGDRDDVTELRRRLEPFSGLMTWYGSGTVGPFDQALGELALEAGDVDAARRHRDAAQRCLDRLRAPVYQPDVDRLSERIEAAS